MADKRLDKNKIAPVDVLDNIGDSAKRNEKKVESLTKAMKELKNVAKTIKGGLAGAKTTDTKSLQEIESLTKKANSTARVKLALDKEILLEQEKIAQVRRNQKKSIKEEVALADAQKGSLQRVRLESKKLRDEKERLNLTTKKGTQRLKIINETLDRNNAILEKNATKLGKQKIAIGRYSKALGGLRNALGGLRNALGQLGIAFGVFALIKDSFNVIKDFQQAQANLASVLGVNVEGMKALTVQAKELGATTRFTASQVSELQLELAKLGFTQQQIQDMTPATLALAEATGTELAQAASVAGATLNGFGLAAKDTQRVVDVMAKSFSSSSLDMEKFKVAMSAVAPVAKNAGFTIEETTALIGTLTDRGIDASSAGTGLRNMFLDSKKAGLTFNEALEQVNNASDKTAESFKLFGKRGATLGVILAENQKSVATLTETLKDSENAAADMAKTQRNTLGGALDLLRSAWEGLILSMDEAGGVGEKLRKGIKFLADNLGTILKVVGKAIRAFIVFRTVMFALKIQQQFKGWKAFGGSVKNLGKNMDKASAGASKFAGSLKSIGIGTAVVLFTEFAAALWNIVSGASSAADKLLRLNKIRDKGAQERKDFNKDFKQQLKDEKELRDNEIEAAKIQRQQDIKNGASRIEAIKKEKAAIKEANKEFLLFLQGRKDPLGRSLIGNLRLTLDSARQELLLAEQQLKIDKQITNEAVRNIQVFKSREKIATLENNIKLLVSEITLRRDAVHELNAENEEIEENKELKKEGNKESEKQISLLREITDEKIKQITNVEDREVLQARVASARLIEDKNKTNANEVEKAEFAKEVNETLVIDISNIRQKFRDEEIEAEKAHLEEINALILEAEESEEAQIDAAFERSRIEKRIELLSDFDKDRKQVDREYTEFLLEQIETRLLNVEEGSDEERDILLEQAQLRRTLFDQDKKDEEDKIAAERKRQEEFRDMVDKFGNEVLDGLVARSKKKQDLLDKEIAKEQELVDALREGANDQNAIATQSITALENSIEEKERRKIEEAEREERLEEVKAIWNSLNNFLDQGDSLPEATIKATTGVLGVKKLVEAIPGFFKGTKGRLGDEDTAIRSGQDGHLIWADKNEMIFNGGQVDKAEASGMNTTEDIINSAVMFHQLNGVKEANDIYNQTVVTVDTSNLEKKVDNLTKVMKNKPETTFHPHIVQGIADGVVKTVKKGSITNRYITHGK